MFNEGERLPNTLPRLVDLACPEVEVVLVDDGSTDDTPAMLGPHADHPHVSVLRQPQNQGKGAAIRRGVHASRGRAVVFMDADLATDVSCLETILAALEHADVAIGSRAHPDSVLHDTSRHRSRLGGRFNQLVRSLTGLPFRDTQCGFKAFSAQAASTLFALSRVHRFAFDVELLSLATAHGMHIVEVPVDWTEVQGSTLRKFADPARMAFDVVSTSLRRHPPAHVVTLTAVTDPNRVDDVASTIRNEVREGDLVIAGADRVWVAMPGTSNADAVLARLARNPYLRDFEVELALGVASLAELMRHRGEGDPNTFEDGRMLRKDSYLARWT
jgi:hypothetical protein